MATIQDITYSIVKLNKTIASITVRYKTNNFPTGLLYDLDLPINNGTVITGQALDDFILQNAPIAQISDAETVYAWTQERKTLVASIDLSGIIVTPEEKSS